VDVIPRVLQRGRIGRRCRERGEELQSSRERLADLARDPGQRADVEFGRGIGDNDQVRP
jgi:hypothetical protein